MVKGLTRSLGRGVATVQKIMKHTVTVRAAALEVDGATGVGFGTAVVGDLPEGNVLFLGATSYLQITTADAGITATFDGDYGVGTTPADDATITGADVDVIPSTALGAATAGISPRVRGASAVATCGTIHDNTDGSLELNLNVLIDDAAISADDTASTFDLDMVLSYVVLGDD